MKRLVLLCTLALASPVHADQVDLSTSTCKQFLESGEEGIKTTLTWLDGYYKDEDDPPVIDTDKLVANSKKLGEFCAKNPTLGLITAADKALGK
ncbi:HdeA/HdeB family chaperone [Methylobacterium thuringiense]|uniref:Acid stress chaperone HdeA n=1 Tax=Methylobacterium thuringiense TaxID=1003091 RepID=A0ABQ4TR73_9HYPH|nr:HdeA/HdeB family chaperone [Methylobacterium thuringiense]GJE56869.1 hypothetical protein EKPJFOCH_3379 [Methylobacterium thuringiense]